MEVIVVLRIYFKVEFMLYTFKFFTFFIFNFELIVKLFILLIKL